MSVKIYCYHGRANYGTNALAVSVGQVDVYFSYSTPVAFRHPEAGLVVSENCWSTTTGKHLNAIEPNKKARVDRATFDGLYERYIEPLGLVVR